VLLLCDPFGRGEQSGGEDVADDGENIVFNREAYRSVRPTLCVARFEIMTLLQVD